MVRARNLPSHADLVFLANHFSQHGKMLAAIVHQDPATLLPTGKAVIEFATHEQACRAANWFRTHPPEDGWSVTWKGTGEDSDSGESDVSVSEFSGGTVHSLQTYYAHK